ncbi:MAG: electron transfer flavoprotein subunit alpha [Verrucomicrobia bacterium]|nr:electron transfer flavoprotein subunit alpha [Verrucomicrobiota bacterium]
MKMVPDVVEPLEIAEDGKNLDKEAIRMMASESSEHALEQALILKDSVGAEVTVAAIEAPELDDALFSASAKGAVRVIKITPEQDGLRADISASVLKEFIKQECGSPGSDTLIFTGSQAIDDLQGELGPTLAEQLGLPFIGVVTSIKPVEGEEGKVTAIKEYSGGLRGEYEVALPAVVGIQAAEQPSRYVPFAKIRAAMKSGSIESTEITPEVEGRGVEIARMYVPEVTGRAEMIEGDPETVAARLIEIFKQNGILG